MGGEKEEKGGGSCTIVVGGEVDAPDRSFRKTGSVATEMTESS